MDACLGGQDAPARPLVGISCCSAPLADNKCSVGCPPSKRPRQSGLGAGHVQACGKTPASPHRNKTSISQLRPRRYLGQGTAIVYGLIGIAGQTSARDGPMVRRRPLRAHGLKSLRNNHLMKFANLSSAVVGTERLDRQTMFSMEPPMICPRPGTVE